MLPLVNYRSDSDEEIPKRVKITIPDRPTIEEYKSNVKERPKSLFSALPQPKNIIEQEGLGSKADGQSRLELNISRKKPEKLSEKKIEKKHKEIGKTSDKKKKVEGNENESETQKEEVLEFFSLRMLLSNIATEDSIVKAGPSVGPSLPSRNEQLQSFQSLKSVQVIKSKTNPIHDKGKNKIVFETISYKDQLGNAYLEKTKYTTIDDVPLDGFENLKDQAIGAAGNRVNSIMALAQRAKKEHAEREKQKSERKTVQKIVRAKYGW